jgi:hypothetical protein
MGRDAVEALAMDVARAYERCFGGVRAVHTPELVCVQGLRDYPGFDVLSFCRMADGNRERLTEQIRASRHWRYCGHHAVYGRRVRYEKSPQSKKLSASATV